MRKTVNRENIHRRVYGHKLAVKTVQNPNSDNYGKEFINGTIDVATDDECLNVVTVNFTYVTEFTKTNARNATYAALKKIIEEGKTVAVDGKEFATKVSISTSLATNDFYTTRNGAEELVSAKRNDGGFVTIVDTLKPNENERNTFEFDFLANKTRLVEADEERYIPADYLELGGYVFNFRGEIQPVTLVCKKPEGISVFESLEISESNPVFINLKGNINNTSINIEKTQDTLFGESVVSYSRNIKEWVIDTAIRTYDIVDDSDEEGKKAGISIGEIKDCIAKRNTYLADVKRRQDEYQASRNAAPANPASAASAPSAQGGFLW